MNPLDKHFGRFGNRLFQSAYIYSQMRDKKIPDIYVQDPRYFERYGDEIKKLFGDGIVDTMIEGIVGVHVRRGDNPSNINEPTYSENPFYVNLADDTKYYEEAMDFFPGYKFIIVSDDPEYCRARFKGKDISIANKVSEISDFKLLTNCEHQIIANSSFSWWAGYLNPNPDKKVVYPRRWFTDGVNRVGFPRMWVGI